MSYAIIEVYDYKGGELSTNVNLTKEHFISELSEKFENYVDEEDFSSLDTCKKFVANTIDDGDFLSTYAGGDGFCGELYEIKNGAMVEVDFKDFIDDIARYIFKNWNN